MTIPEGGYSDVWLPTVGQVTGVKFAGARADLLASRLWLNIDTSTGDRARPGVGRRPLHDARAAADQGRARQAAGVAVHRRRGNLAREPGARLPRRARSTPGARTRRARGTSCAPSAAAMRATAPTPTVAPRTRSRATTSPGHSRGRLARFVGADPARRQRRAVRRDARPRGQPASTSRPAWSWAPSCPRAAWSRATTSTPGSRCRTARGTWIPLLPNDLPARPQPEAQPAAVQDRRAEDRRPGAAAGRHQPAERAPGTRPGPERRQPQEAAEEAVRPLGLADLAALAGLLRRASRCSLLVAIYWLIRGAKAWRRRRHATRGTATARVAWAWDDLMNSARSYGHALPAPGHPARAGGGARHGCPTRPPLRRGPTR